MVNYPANNMHYTLQIGELEEDTVHVISFEGIENISRLFKYSIQLLSEIEKDELQPEDIQTGILNKKATFTMNRGDEDPLTIYGIISRFEKRGRSDNYYFYYAELVPRMWRLGLNFQSRIFQEKDINEIVSDVLKAPEFSSDDLDKSQLTASYPILEFAVQYNESDFNFLNRRLEHFGIYYYFDINDNEKNDVIVFKDSIEDPTDYPQEIDLGVTETISQFIYQAQVVTGKTKLKDYNYDNPSNKGEELEVETKSDIQENFPGTYYNYGDHYNDDTVGQLLANVRNEEIICNSAIYKGKSDCRLFRAGKKFTHEDKQYLLTHVSTTGDQSELFVFLQPSDKIRRAYENYFEALPEDINFRPRRLTPQPKIHGILNAWVDAAGDEEHAKLDEQGRYKVVLPFDLSGQADGEASHYIRMLQPYAGGAYAGKDAYGVHFPLHKGTEVLLSFIDGNPDRPVMAGAVPNPVTVSPVTDINQTKSVIRDHYGNEIIFDATPGQERLHLHSPNQVTGIELGSTINNYYTKADKHDATLGNKLDFCFGSKGDVFIGNALDFRAGLIYNLLGGLEFNLALAGRYTQNWAYDVKNSSGPIISTTKKDILSSSKKDNVIAAGDQVCIVGGSIARSPLPDPMQPDEIQTNRSIIGVYPEKLSFSVGDKLTTHKIDSERRLETDPIDPRKDLYENTPKTKYNVGVIAPSIFASLLTMAWGIWKDIDEESAGWGAFLGVPGILSAIGAGIVAILSYVKEMTDAKIEPIVHKNPASLLELGHDGKINIHSKENEINLEVGDVTPQGQARVEANSLSKFSMSKIQNQNKGKIDLSTKIDANGSNKISLNDQNLEIKRPLPPASESRIKMNDNGLEIFTYKDLDICSKNELLIQSMDSNITLKTMGEIYAKAQFNHRNLKVLF